MNRNVTELINFNLDQIRKNLDITINSYTDILYQIYTDDEIIRLVNEINNNSENALDINSLREKLRKLINTKEAIRSLAIVSSNGKPIFYDTLTASSIESSWLHSDTDETLLYTNALNSKGSLMISTAFATQLGDKKYYLFHISNKMVDYINIKKDPLGVAIISIDEEVLLKTCNVFKDENLKNIDTNNINFIIDKNDKIISFPNQNYLCRNLSEYTKSNNNKNDTKYINLIKKSKILHGKSFLINKLYDDKIGWTIINAIDQDYILRKVYTQQRYTVFFSALVILISIVVIIYISGNLSESIEKVLKAMKTAQTGELSVQVKLDDNDGDEISAIATQFNKMIITINNLIEKVKNTTTKQKEAEIRALEAQINPHFLYNTLDSINWMVIDKCEYEISNIIKSLAQILRYSIDRSNSIVKIKEEIEWLRQYIYIQQTRFKHSFECNMDIDESTMEYNIKKLLLQPFIENSIIHGFEYLKKGGILKISIKDYKKFIIVTIEDNGKGINEDTLKSINTLVIEETEDKNNSLGIKNVFNRIKMYYGEDCNWNIFSTSGKGTLVYMKLPVL